MITVFRVFPSICLAIAASALFVVDATAQVPSGTLDVRGSVRITEGSSGNSMIVRDTNYSWFSGDRIEVREGYGILYINEGNSFGMLEGTDVTLVIDNGTITGDLDSGNLVYALEGEDRRLIVNSESFEYEARPARDLAPCLGLTAVGLIEAIEPTLNRVTVQSGELDGYNQSRTVERLVEPGEQFEFTPQQARRIELELPEEVEEQLDTDRSALPCVVWWTRQEAAGAAIAGLSSGSGVALAFGGIVGGNIIYPIIDDDDDEEEDPPPVSP